MKKLTILTIFLTILFILTGCSSQKEYNYNRLNVKTIVNNENLTEQFEEAYSTVYFFPKSETKSYLYIIKETDKDEYSLDTASSYLSTMKDILKNGYQLSKKETKTQKKKNNQFICNYEYSAKDEQNNIYTAKTKYIYDIDTKEAIMLICFIDDKEDKDIKNSFLKTFNETILEKTKEAQ